MKIQAETRIGKACRWAAVGSILAMTAITTTAAVPAKASDAPKQQKKPNISHYLGR